MVESFEQTVGGFFLVIFCERVRKQHFHWQWAQPFRFFTCGNYGDANAGKACPELVEGSVRATQSAGGEYGCVGIGSYGNVGRESQRGGAIVDGARNFRQCSEKRLHARE